MKRKAPVILDGPEGQTIGVCVIFSVLCLFTLPFLLLLTMGGFQDDPVAVSWFEIVFHVIVFLVIFFLFREFLTDSWDNFRIRRGDVLFYVKIGAGICLGITLFWYLLYVILAVDILYLPSFGTLPIAEMNLFMLPSEAVVFNPIFGTLCMVALVPLTTCCIYYAVGFIHLHNIRPWLGYLVVAAVIALPRIGNAITFWHPGEQLIIYATQLPVHWIACWTLKKTDTIWAPIFVLMAANLMACLILISTFVL